MPPAQKSSRIPPPELTSPALEQSNSPISRSPKNFATEIAKSHHPASNLASLRKTDRMSNDTAITRLLYAILSQKCLKDVSHIPRLLFQAPPLQFQSLRCVLSPPRLFPNLPLFRIPTFLIPHHAPPPPSPFPAPHHPPLPQNKSNENRETKANAIQNGRSTGTK